jgi:hypothetical protein
VNAPQATAVSARVATLIARHHDGDENAAAASLGIEATSLTGLLSGDWRRFSLDALAALVREHQVSVQWLLGSTPTRTLGQSAISPMCGRPIAGEDS